VATKLHKHCSLINCCRFSGDKTLKVKIEAHRMSSRHRLRHSPTNPSQMMIGPRLRCNRL
jgi:hypothetical protein